VAVLPMETAIRELRHLRSSGIDDPRRVVELAARVLVKGGDGSAGDEYWTIIDQVAVAALETDNDVLAEECIGQLSAKFPTSPRTVALVGMQLEVQEKLAEATEYYEYILKNDPTNIMAWKRQVALSRSMKKTTEAINSLTLLLDTFPNDTEAWAELAELYLSQDMLLQTAYCLEELILLQPFLHYVHAQYAEILWLLEKEASALKHWSRSVELCSDFMRGWFGVKTATKKILGGPVNSNRGRGEEVELPAVEIIRKLDLLATARLSELSILATPAEKSAVKLLIGDVTASITM